MERIFVNNNFHYVDLVPVANGSSWTPEALAREIASKFRTKKANADIIVVWIDLEKQACGSDGLADMIESALVDAGAERSKICICIPDKMSENIILADELVIRQEFDAKEYAYKFEGQNGKSILKMMYAGRQITYRETSHGVALLKRFRLESAAYRSESARLFFSKLSSSVDCWWLKSTKVA